jgi:hypothetical protein
MALQGPHLTRHSTFARYRADSGAHRYARPSAYPGRDSTGMTNPLPYLQTLILPLSDGGSLFCSEAFPRVFSRVACFLLRVWPWELSLGSKNAYYKIEFVENEGNDSTATKQAKRNGSRMTTTRGENKSTIPWQPTLRGDDPTYSPTPPRTPPPLREGQSSQIQLASAASASLGFRSMHNE